MKTLILAAIRCSLMFTAVTASLFSVRPAQAYTVTLQQVGSNVVATGSGAINLTGLTLLARNFVRHGSVGSSKHCAYIGIAAGNGLTLYTYGIHRTDEFRGREHFLANTGSGDSVGIMACGGQVLLFRASGLCLRRCSIEQRDL